MSSRPIPPTHIKHCIPKIVCDFLLNEKQGTGGSKWSSRSFLSVLLCGIIKTDEAGTLDFSGVPAFLLLKKMLTAAGYDYEEVQKMVNFLLE